MSPPATWALEEGDLSQIPILSRSTPLNDNALTGKVSPSADRLDFQALFDDIKIRYSRSSMSRFSADVAASPEKTGGLAGMFKSLTGGKSSKGPSHQPSTTPPHQLDTAQKNAIYGGPPDYEALLEQLKAGNTLPERIAAADSLRIAVLDYPLSGVHFIQRNSWDNANVV